MTMMAVATPVYTSPTLAGFLKLEVVPAGGRRPGSSSPTDEDKPADANEDILLKTR